MSGADYKADFVDGSSVFTIKEIGA